MRYSGGILRHDQVDASTRSNLINGLKDTLVAAGWSKVDVYAWDRVTFAGVPSDGGLITVAGTAYTWKTTLTGANQIKRGATADESADNLIDALNDNAANEGVTYGSGTAQNAYVEGIKDGTDKVIVRSRTAGPVSYSESQTTYEFSFEKGAINSGGYDLTSAQNNAGHRLTLQLRDGGSGTQIYIYGTDGVYTSTDFSLATAADRILEVFANKFSVYTCLLGSTTANLGTGLQAGVLYIRDNAHMPRTIAAVTDNGGLVKVETNTAHNLVTGDHIYIAWAEGLTSINGRWEISVDDATHYTLIGSTYSAGYTANSARAAGPNEIARAWYLIAPHFVPGFGFVGDTLRQALNFSGYEAFAFNQFAYTASGNNFFIDVPISAWGTIVLNFPGSADLIEARCGWPVSASGSTRFKVGELYNAFYANMTVPVDTLDDNVDSHNWFCYSTSNGASLWIARTAAV